MSDSSSTHAFARADERAAEINSRLVLGLDLDDKSWKEISEGTQYENKVHGRYEYCMDLIQKLHTHIVGIKPNLAFWEGKWNNDAKRAELGMIMHDTAKYYPELVRILDVKRGDVVDTQTAWGESDLSYEPDIVTIQGHMGPVSTIEPFLKLHPDMGLIVVAASSNKDGMASQGRYAGGIRNYQWTVLDSLAVNQEQIGFVVGGTLPEEVGQNIRAAVKEYGLKQPLFLRPGLGKQGGKPDGDPRSLWPISSGFTNPKYLNGRTPEQAAIEWKGALNAVAPYGIKSMSEQLVDGLVENDLIWIANSADETTWRKLAAGGVSPIFFQIRDLLSFDKYEKMAAHLIAKRVKDAGLNPDGVAGVAYGALDIATVVGDCLEKPRAIFRKEGIDEELLEKLCDRLCGERLAGNIKISLSSFEKMLEALQDEARKNRRNKDSLVGKIISGKNYLVIEDVATTGKSMNKELITNIREREGVVTDAIVLINRKQGADQLLMDNGVRLHYVITQNEAAEKIDLTHPGRPIVMKYLSENTK
ncbi:MAG: orotidine 5'-phosphate decarboxylase [Rickettsiales bacterium]|jgi:orotate phosphoribosyltransferase/orotidine-5'-phosphate decarboxylase|nr:orotidine 5'-phosphate decarboxylase [Rickettsiales bacterium]